MLKLNKKIITMTFIVLAWCFSPIVLANNNQSSVNFEQFIKQKNEAFITLKLTFKSRSGDGRVLQPFEIPGVLIDKEGLILASNVLSGGRNENYVAIENKVLIGDDTIGEEAELLVRDKQRDLAWFKIKKPKQSAYQFIDFNQPSAIHIGDDLFSLYRLPSYFGRELIVSKGYLAGVLSKPRSLLMANAHLGRSTNASFGWPAFDMSGQAIGFTVLQVPNNDPRSLDSSDYQGAILPSSEIMRATQLALDAVKEDQLKDR